jgi:hypothetical protein
VTFITAYLGLSEVRKRNISEQTEGHNPLNPRHSVLCGVKGLLNGHLDSSDFKLPFTFKEMGIFF